jgi:hypothetical protein
MIRITAFFELLLMRPQCIWGVAEGTTVAKFTSFLPTFVCYLNEFFEVFWIFSKGSMHRLLFPTELPYYVHGGKSKLS